MKKIIMLAMVFIVLIGWNGYSKARTVIIYPAYPAYGPDPYEATGEVLGAALAAGCVTLMNNARREPAYTYEAPPMSEEFDSNSCIYGGAVYGVGSTIRGQTCIKDPDGIERWHLGQ
jgi:predicted outer membrane repeat protein